MDGSEVGRERADKQAKWAEERRWNDWRNQVGRQVTIKGAFSKARVADALGSIKPGSATDWLIDSDTLVLRFLLNWMICFLDSVENNVLDDGVLDDCSAGN